MTKSGRLPRVVGLFEIPWKVFGIRHLLHAHAGASRVLIPQEFAQSLVDELESAAQVGLGHCRRGGLVDDRSQPRFAGGDLSFGFPGEYGSRFTWADTRANNSRPLNGLTR